MPGRTAVALAALLAVLLASRAAGHGTTELPLVAAPGSPVPVVSLPGATGSFSSYDFRQDDFGDVDWPVAFVFRGAVSAARVKDGLCEGTAGPWRYCEPGGAMFLYSRGVDDARPAVDFVRDRGVKRFNQDCSSTAFTAHVRLYELPRRSAPRRSGSVVVGTAHLDFADRGGCSGRIHGYPDVAQAWLTEALRTVPGWTVTPAAWDLRSRSGPYVVLRGAGGADIPHVYGQAGLATDVYVP